MWPANFQLRRQRIASGNEHVRGGAPLPKPEIMMLVNWDRELAQLAQRLADQCEFAHDDCRATVRYPYAGQTVGEVRWRVPSDSEQLSVQRSIRRVFDAWWGERRRVQPEQLTAPFKLTAKRTVWGHFSQLAVWTLRAVGCGAVRHGHPHTRMLLVCDFSHTNMLGQRTINPGPLASCPPHTARRTRTVYPLLCAPVRRPTPSPSYDNSEIYDDDEYFDEPTEPTSRLTTKRGTYSHKYMEMTPQIYGVHHNAFETDGRRLKITLQSGKNELNFHKNNLKEQSQKDLVGQNQKTMIKPYYGHLRDISENVNDSNLKKLRTFVDDNPLQESHPKSIKQEPIPRPRWKHIRKRPQRPGANALLKKPPEKLLQRSSISFLMLDENDMDQFFRDTGFDLNWKEKSLSK
ncbi:unnamed protein product, partial [Brenthis ino]